MTINFESRLPLYYQLREEIEKDILNGTLREGDRIPSERELGEQYNLSSTTVGIAKVSGNLHFCWGLKTVP
ncbi:MAG: GntR family transcriptional regulator [Proteobacteria bacterium]|nr:GntR family transcriptional regulator [Pseudomonadota bacterium]